MAYVLGSGAGNSCETVRVEREAGMRRRSGLQEDRTSALFIAPPPLLRDTLPAVCEC